MPNLSVVRGKVVLLVAVIRFTAQRWVTFKSPPSLSDALVTHFSSCKDRLQGAGTTEQSD